MPKVLYLSFYNFLGNDKKLMASVSRKKYIYCLYFQETHGLAMESTLLEMHLILPEVGCPEQIQLEMGPQRATCSL